jgi:hypothetical protein
MTRREMDWVEEGASKTVSPPPPPPPPASTWLTDEAKGEVPPASR